MPNSSSRPRPGELLNIEEPNELVELRYHAAAAYFRCTKVEITSPITQ